MTDAAGGHILVVDDVEKNARLLADVLTAKGFRTRTALSGEAALQDVAAHPPSLILLDVMMPGISGYDVCRTLRADPAHAVLPIVLVTALDPSTERVKGLEAGADDFLSKPVNQAELLARVRSLLRIKTLYDEVQRQKAELQQWNQSLEQRVADGVRQLEQVGRLKRFFSPQLADMLVQGGDELLKTHRREICVVFIDLRGFTTFTERAEPEEVMELLHSYHQAMGQIVVAHSGTLERFAGDSVMVFFNDPVPIDKPAEAAVRMALQMQQAFTPLAQAWAKRGFDLALGCGIAQGYATLGAIGFEGRWDYAAIGNVTNMAARLCGEAGGGQVLVDRKAMAHIEDLVHAAPVGPLVLKGLAQPVMAFAVSELKPSNS